MIYLTCLDMHTVCITNKGMDPQSTIELIGECAVEGDHDGAQEHTTNLLEWFSAGGYAVGSKPQRDAIRLYFSEPTDANLHAIRRLLE